MTNYDAFFRDYDKFRVSHIRHVLQDENRAGPSLNDLEFRLGAVGLRWLWQKNSTRYAFGSYEELYAETLSRGYRVLNPIECAEIKTKIRLERKRFVVSCADIMCEALGQQLQFVDEVYEKSSSLTGVDYMGSLMTVSELPPGPAIYEVVLASGMTSYIGETAYVDRRLLEHEKWSTGCTYRVVRIHDCDSKEDRLAHEAAQIVLRLEQGHPLLNNCSTAKKTRKRLGIL